MNKTNKIGTSKEEFEYAGPGKHNHQTIPTLP